MLDNILNTSYPSFTAAAPLATSPARSNQIINEPETFQPQNRTVFCSLDIIAVTAIEKQLDGVA